MKNGKKAHKYHNGDLVWLAQFDNGDEVIPRQRAEILGDPENEMYTVFINPADTLKYWGDDDDGWARDDGLRELSEEQIEGPCTIEEWIAE